MRLYAIQRKQHVAVLAIGMNDGFSNTMPCPHLLATYALVEINIEGNAFSGQPRMAVETWKFERINLKKQVLSGKLYRTDKAGSI